MNDLFNEWPLYTWWSGASNSIWCSTCSRKSKRIKYAWHFYAMALNEKIIPRKQEYLFRTYQTRDGNIESIHIKLIKTIISLINRPFGHWQNHPRISAEMSKTNSRIIVKCRFATATQSFCMKMTRKEFFDIFPRTYIYAVG